MNYFLTVPTAVRLDSQRSMGGNIFNFESVTTPHRVTAVYRRVH